MKFLGIKYKKKRKKIPNSYAWSTNWTIFIKFLPMLLIFLETNQMNELIRDKFINLRS